MQKRGNSIAKALKLHLICIKSSIWLLQCQWSHFRKFITWTAIKPWQNTLQTAKHGHDSWDVIYYHEQRTALKMKIGFLVYAFPHWQTNIHNDTSLLQVYSPSPEEYSQESSRYSSPKPGGPGLYGEYSYPPGKSLLHLSRLFVVCVIHVCWKPRVVIMPTWSSLGTLQVVVIVSQPVVPTDSSDNKVWTMSTFCFQYFLQLLLVIWYNDIWKTWSYAYTGGGLQYICHVTFCSRAHCTTLAFTW